MDGTWVELCAGTAALTWKLLGFGRSPTPYMGGKQRYARRILEVVKPRKPARVLLVEPGEYARTLQAILEHGPRVAAHLRTWDAMGDRELFDALRGAPPPEDPAARAAVHLYLQARTYRAKPVHPRASRAGWKLHGYADPWHRARSPKSTNTGPCNTLPTLAGRVETLHAGAGWSTHGFDPERGVAERMKRLGQRKTVGPTTGRQTLAQRVLDLSAGVRTEITVLQARAQDVPPIPDADVVLDPPYRGTTGYGHDFPREDVVQVALRWARAGARVHVCEGEPVQELVDLGWQVTPIGKDTRVTLGNVREYLTSSP